MKIVTIFLCLSISIYMSGKVPDFSLHPIKTGGIFGSLTVPLLQKLSRLFHADVFIETGTLLGDTTWKACQVFSQIHTIELSNALYQQACARFAPHKKVHVHAGDSATVLPSILKTLQGTAIFWLDGHYSCGSTAKGEVNTPVLAELTAILEYRCDAIVLIDDIRFFQKPGPEKHNTPSADYPDLLYVINVIKASGKQYNYVILGDTLLLYPSHYKVSVSPLMKACTEMRLHESSCLCQQCLMNRKVVSQASGAELTTLKNLSEAFLSCEESQKFNLDRYYRLWYGLTQK